MILTYFKRNGVLLNEVWVEMGKQQGKFWPRVRALIWEKAQQLYRKNSLGVRVTILRA